MSAPSDYFSTLTVQDDRIQAITDKIQYAVIKGASSNNPIQNAATSISTSSIVFNQPIPSETTIVDRRIMIKTTFLFKLQKNHITNTKILYPQSFNFAPFPLHQLTQTLSLTLNNTSVSTQIKDILPAMLRCMDTEDLYEYNSMCPTSFDRYARYSDEAYAYLDADTAAVSNADILHLASGAVNSYSNFQGFKGLRDEFIPRGAYAIDGYFSDAAGNTSQTQQEVAALDANTPFYVKLTTFEPVLISPLVWGKHKGQAGMYGLQNIILQYTLSADASRAIRSVNNIQTPQLQAILSSEIHMNFLTPQPSTLLNARNVLPHYQIDRLVSSFPNTVPTAYNNNSAGAPIQSQTFTLSVIPDYIVVYIRPPTSKLAHYKPDSFASISGINIQFANTSGILSTAQINNLYQISHENGYNGSFLEWANKAYGSGNNQTHLAYLPTSGSVCILRFGKDINLPEFAAPGCVGNWSLKIDVVAKQTYVGQFNEETWNAADFNPRDPTGQPSLGMELNILAVMSGCMVLERGQSSVHLGLLTRQDALDASNAETVGFQGSQKLVGKGFFDGLGSVFGKVKDFASNALGTVKQMAPLIKMGANALGKPEIANTMTKIGLGRTGGADYSGNNLSHRIA
jgi:hypothetical protein